MRPIQPWVVLACVVLVASPLVQGLAGGSGVSLPTLLAACALGVIGLAVYVRMLARTRRDLDR